MRSTFLPPGDLRLPIRLLIWGATGIALNVGIARFTYGVILPPLRLDLGIGYLAGGSLNAIHLAGYLIGTLLAPALARRYGMPRLSTGAHLLVAAGALICAAAPSNATLGLGLLAVGRLATGIGAGAGIVAILVLAFGAISRRSRPFVSAIVWSGMGIAIIASGLAISWLSQPQIGWRSTFVVAAIVALAVAFLRPRSGALNTSLGAPAAGGVRFSAGNLATGQWLFLTVAYLLFGIGYIAYSTFAGARLAAMQASVMLTGAAWTAFGVAAIAGAALTVVVIAMPRLKQFALVIAATSGALGALIAASDAAGAALAGALLVGLGLAATPSIVTAYIRDRSDEQQYPTAFSLVSAALGIGQLIGPVMAGALADSFGTAVVPLLAAGAYAAGALFAWMDMRQYRAVSPP